MLAGLLYLTELTLLRSTLLKYDLARQCALLLRIGFEPMTIPILKINAEHSTAERSATFTRTAL